MAITEANEGSDSRGLIRDEPWTYARADGTFGWTTSLDAPQITLRVYGELDLYSATPLQAALNVFIVHQGNADVAIDMADLTFLDSSGIAMLVWAHKMTAQRDGALTIHNVPDSVRKVLEITGLTKVLNMEPPHLRPLRQLAN